MKTFAAICAVLMLITISEKADCIVRYSRDKMITVTPAFKDKPEPAFFHIPVTKYDPKFKEYVKEHSDICSADLYCLPNDYSYCLIMDKLGHLSGIQIGYKKEYADKVQHYSFANNSNYIATKICNETIYAVRIWFTNPEELTATGRPDVSEIIEGLWAYVDGKLLRFDHRCQSVGPSIGSFDLQGCLPMKGTLYVHNFNKHSCCENGFFLFLVYDRGSLVGFGHAAPGYFPPGPTRDWFDHPKGEQLAKIVPAPPSCFEKLFENGLTSSVTFLIDDPYNINCPVCGC